MPRGTIAVERPDLAAQWHPTLNVDLTPDLVTVGSSKHVWWRCDAGHVWQARVDNRNTINNRTGRFPGCPECSYHRVAHPGMLPTDRPDLVLEWDRHRNLMRPNTLATGSTQMVWWICPTEGHRYRQRVADRVGGAGCWQCTGTEPSWVRSGKGRLTKPLIESRPDIAAEWDLEQNGGEPGDIRAASKKLVWWRCPSKHPYQATVLNRTKKFAGCPTCPPAKLASVAEMRPSLVGEWHPELNDDITLDTISAGSEWVGWWMCKDGHEWQARVQRRAREAAGCPVCNGSMVLPGVNDLATTRPDLAKEWNRRRNGKLTPEMVSRGSRKKVWWRCKAGHEWEATCNGRDARGCGCAQCHAGTSRWAGTNLAAEFPKAAAQWHPTRNGTMTPDQVGAGSNRLVWWLCGACGNEWEQPILDRRSTPGTGCRACKQLSGFRPGVPILVGPPLSELRPDMVRLWHPTLNGDLAPDLVGRSCTLPVVWVLDCGHTMRRAPAKVTRSRRLRCPECASWTESAA